MKWHWKEEELCEHWSLTPEEVGLISESTSYGRGRSGRERLGFAIMLKYFQYHGRFPATIKEIPFDVLTFITDQIKTPKSDIDNFDWYILN